MDDLVEREGIYYEKFADIPFSGEITGEEKGSIENGQREGAWVSYHVTGQLSYKGNYKNGKTDGAWIRHWENGKLYSKGNYKNGKTDGAWFQYYENGQLKYRGNYKNDKEEGAWVGYYESGIVFEPWTGTFKDGVRISN